MISSKIVVKRADFLLGTNNKKKKLLTFTDVAVQQTKKKSWVTLVYRSAFTRKQK